jgi:hypothetical protein
MVSSFEQWYGKTVVLQVTTGESHVPLRGIMIGESGGAVRFRVTGGWEFDVYKSLILAVERVNGPGPTAP